MSELEWLDIFGDNLREMLLETNMTQGELANETGLTEAAISNYINKKRVPTLRAIVNIAYALGCDTDELIDFGDTIW